MNAFRGLVNAALITGAICALVHSVVNAEPWGIAVALALLLVLRRDPERYA